MTPVSLAHLDALAEQFEWAARSIRKVTSELNQEAIYVLGIDAIGEITEATDSLVRAIEAASLPAEDRSAEAAHEIQPLRGKKAKRTRRRRP